MSKKGDTVVKFIDSANLVPSAIDLSFCELSLAHLLEWTVLPDLCQNYKVRPRWKYLVQIGNYMLTPLSVKSQLPNNRSCLRLGL